MIILEIAAMENGGHKNQSVSWDEINVLSLLPPGWAYVPKDMPIPDTFPFVNVEAEDGVVTNMTPGVVPPPEPDPPEPPSGDYATKEDVEAVYNELANAFREGVNGYEQ